MKTTQDFKKFISELTLGIFIVTTLNPIPAIQAYNSKENVIYPLKEISKLECRFKDFNTLESNCKQNLPILKTKDYSKYIKQNDGYNDYTRIYTELWGASYKYGWDVGNGGHIGTDIATAKGTPVYTIADGKVINAKNMLALGNTVSVEHIINGKKIISNYAHLSKINVSKGQKIKIGTKIGEVGSTGNSTGNHLHFQIDLDTPFHPYYYDYNKCPYSYYKITESGVCFNELTQNTIDPLLFLETKGAILNKIKTKTVKNTINRNTIKTNSEDLSIFNRTVYIDYNKNDIKKVQEIFKNMGIYKGTISGKYEDIEETIITYQISKGVIKDRYSLGAGRFGPSTRATTKKDYLIYLKNGKTTINVSKTREKITENNIKIQKISRKNILSREKIERREVADFLKNFNVSLKFKNTGGNISVGKTEILKLVVTDRRGKLFKGNMPGGMTFAFEESKIKVFPKKLFYFTDGKRDIKITGLKEGNTIISIKIGEETVKRLPIKIYKEGKTIYPKSSVIVSNKKITIGDNKTGIVVFKDDSGRNLINLKYGSTFKLKASNNNLVCIKSGDLKNIKSIYKNKCKDSDYRNTIDFSYKDTVGGLLIYDYKATSKNFTIEVINNYKNIKLGSKKLTVTNPKGLKSDYAYKDNVIDLLEQGVVDGINKGYFLEERDLSEKDALIWIKKTLNKINDEVYDNETKQKIDKNLLYIETLITKASKTRTVSRETFLNMTYDYLVFSNNTETAKSYRDLDNNQNIKVASIFKDSTTWKDKFGKNYFRPNEKITRGEGTYLLSNVLKNYSKLYLTRK